MRSAMCHGKCVVTAKYCLATRLSLYPLWYLLRKYFPEDAQQEDACEYLLEKEGPIHEEHAHFVYIRVYPVV